MKPESPTGIEVRVIAWLENRFGEWQRPVDFVSCGTGLAIVLICVWLFG